MKISFVALLAVLFLSITPGMGQKTKDYSSIYSSAVSDYKSARYNDAMNKLAPLTNQSAPNKFAEYAHYYYALSAYQLKRYKESRQMLTQLIGRYPDWNRKNDVYYLLGANYLAVGQWRDAIGTFDKIKDSSFASDIQSLKQNYLYGIQDLAAMINLQKQFPDDQDIAVELVQYIENSPKSSSADIYYAEQLKKKYKIKASKSDVAQQKPKKSTPKRDSQWTKGYLNVAVLLPFRLNEFDVNKSRSNQFAYDYYLGLLQARETLQAEGVNIKLVTYDVGTDEKLMNIIVGTPLFQESDLVLGPLYNSTFGEVAEYASGAEMMLVNPLATDGALLKSRENVYLARPSIEFQTKKAVQQMKRVVSGLNAAIFYGNSAKDSSMAILYAAELKAKGGKVMLMKKIGSSLEQMEGGIPTFETQKPDHIALFSSFSSTGSNLMQILSERKLTWIPVVANSASFKASLKQLSKWGSRLYLIETEYVDPEKVREFQKKYYQVNNSFPSVYSYQGYDQLLFFGRALNKYKGDFKQGLASKFNDDSDAYLLGGFDYSKGHENQISPVLKYDGTKWVRVN